MGQEKKTEENTMANTETQDKKGNTEFHLEQGESNIFNAMAKGMSVEIFEIADAHRQTYENMKHSVDSDAPESVRNVVGKLLEKLARSEMILEHQYYAHLDNRKKYLSLARESFQEAIEAATSKEELEKCADSIQNYLLDEQWAHQVRKDIYGDEYAEMESQHNLLNVETIVSDYKEIEKLLNATKKDMMEFYKIKQPANYGNKKPLINQKEK